MQRSGQMKILAVSFNISMYDFQSKTDYLPTKYKVLKPLASTILELIDASLPSDNNPNQAVLRLAVNADDDNWLGAVIYQDINDGYGYKAISAANTQATTGFVLNKIPAVSSLLFDESSSIIVQLLHGTLQSVSELALLNGANKALISDELIQFQNAELIGDKKYKLTKLLRGRQGTEWAIDKHKIGDKFILLDKEIITCQISNNLIGKSVNYKAVTIGKTLAETNNITFTYNGKCLKPFSPVHVKAEKDKDNNINITWLRRSRVDNDWQDYVDIPLGEESPKYEIDIKKKKKIIRTLTSNIEAVFIPKKRLVSLLLPLLILS